MSTNEIGRDIQFTDKAFLKISIELQSEPRHCSEEVKEKIYIYQMKKKYKAETFKSQKTEMAVGDHSNFRE